MKNVITAATLSWQTDKNGLEVPHSDNFGDVYFSCDNGLEESKHVFLAGNNLENRLKNVPNFTTFTVGELGFGTGLNILALWKLWRGLSQKNPHARLHIVTTELYPLTKTDLQRALASWPELADLSTQLLEKYPPLIAGLHRLEFSDDNFSIDLWLGDASESLQQVHASTAVNAWFLDGFSPKCNSSLWADMVLSQIRRLSIVDTTVSTFSVAGVIKRGLQEHGFEIFKIKGFGSKREMLTAVLPSFTDDPTAPHKQQQKNIAVVGAGIAGLFTAYSFALRGHQVTLIDKNKPLAGSSGNLRAMLAPKLTPVHHVHEHMHSISYLYSARVYQHLQKKLADDVQPIFEHTGVFDLLKQSNVSHEQVSAYPQDFAMILDTESATQQSQTNLDDVMALEKAGLINPHVLAEYLLKNDNITFIQADITEVAESTDRVQLTTHNNTVITVDTLVLCTAQDCSQLINTLPTPRTTRGQISWLKVTQTQSENLPKVPLKYGGYCALTTNSLGEKQFLLGASFIRGTTDLTVKPEEHAICKEKLCAAIPDIEPLIHMLPPQDMWEGRVGLRAQMPDYLPLVGKVTKNIYSLCALGAKGFAYAPVCAELLASLECGEVAPLPSSLVHKLDPLRFNKPVA